MSQDTIETELAVSVGSRRDAIDRHAEALLPTTRRDEGPYSERRAGATVVGGVRRANERTRARDRPPASLDGGKPLPTGFDKLTTPP